MKFNPFFAVFKKEVKAYLDQPMAYILAVVFLAINAFFYFRTSFLEEVASLRSMFQLLPWIFLFFIPALTMRTWAEERRENTLGMLLSYPVHVWQIILGKYAATVSYVAIILALTWIIPISLSGVGNFDYGTIIAQYLGAFLLMAAMIAVGQWASTLTKNQVVAFIISVAVLFAFVLAGLDFVVLALPYPINLVFQQLGIFSHFQSMTRGLIDARDVLYFVSLAAIFLALSYLWLNKVKRSVKTKEWKTLQATIATFVAIAVVINLFGQSLTVRADITEQKLYSLSPATKSVLRNLDDTIRLTLYRSKKLPTQIELLSRDLQDILADYDKFGANNVDFAIKYPDQNPQIAQEAKQKGIPAVRFNVVREDEFTLQEGYLGLVIEYLDDREVLPFIQQIGDLEYQLTRAMLALQRDRLPVLGYVSDFGGKTLEELSAFAPVLRKEFTVQQISLSSEEGSSEPVQIDESIDALFIAAPTQTYSDAAVQAVRDYVNRGGKIFWLVSGVKIDQGSLTVSANTTGLEPILAEQGITLEKNLVADLASHETVNFSAGLFNYFLPYPLWVKARVGRHVIAGNTSSITMAWPSSIQLSNEQAIPLVTTSPSSVVQTGSYIAHPDQLGSLPKDNLASYTLAAVVPDIPAAQGNEPGRWVVFASNQLLENTMLQQNSQNAALTLNALDWLSQNEALLSIRTKNAGAPVLVWSSAEKKNLVKWGNIAGVPLLVAVAGAVHLIRRKRLSQKHA